jgi:hypothetical protein
MASGTAIQSLSSSTPAQSPVTAEQPKCQSEPACDAQRKCTDAGSRASDEFAASNGCGLAASTHAMDSYRAFVTNASPTLYSKAGTHKSSFALDRPQVSRNTMAFLAAPAVSSREMHRGVPANARFAAARFRPRVHRLCATNCLGDSRPCSDTRHLRRVHMYVLGIDGQTRY